MDQNTYGVTRDIRSSIKLTGLFYLKDVVIILAFFGSGIILSSLFPNDVLITKIIFIILMCCFGIWLIMKPSSNPLKRNYEIIVFLFANRNINYKSLNYSEFDKKVRREIRAEGQKKHAN